jgi:hypothetical protein
MGVIAPLMALLQIVPLDQAEIGERLIPQRHMSYSIKSDWDNLAACISADKAYIIQANHFSSKRGNCTMYFLLELSTVIYT